MTYNANNAILIKSKDIASVYSQEFNQMFNENKFHNDKQLVYNYNNIILKNKESTNISVYFSPAVNPLTTQVKPLIQNAKILYISVCSI